MSENDKSYLDENLTEKDKESGQTRLPQPEPEGQGRLAEKPYPGDEHRDEKEFERPDEFGDGDRRS